MGNPFLTADSFLLHCNWYDILRDCPGDPPCEISGRQEEVPFLKATEFLPADHAQVKFSNPRKMLLITNNGKVKLTLTQSVEKVYF